MHTPTQGVGPLLTGTEKQEISDAPVTVASSQTPTMMMNGQHIDDPILCFYPLPNLLLFRFHEDDCILSRYFVLNCYI